MINCSHFIEYYSDFRDELLDPDTQTRFARHLEQCESCARYDRVVRSGIRVLLGTPEVSPSPDFVDRLDLRLSMAESGLDGRTLSGAPVSLVVAVALAIGLAAWAPTLRPDARVTRLPAAVAHAPYHPQVLPLVYHPGILSGADPSLTSSRGAAYPREFSAYSLLGTPRSAPGPQLTQVRR